MRKGRKCPKCGYERNAAEAGWCGLCYEPFNRSGKTPGTAPAGQQPPPPPTQPDLVRAAKPLLLVAVALLGIAAALWEHQASGGRIAGGPAENIFAAQTAEADRLLEAHRAEQAAFLTEIEADGLDPEGFGIEGGYTKKLFKLQDSYAGAINALKLPCPSCVDPEKDAPYLAWTRAHQLRETEIMNDFNTRYARLVKLSAATAR